MNETIEINDKNGQKKIAQVILRYHDIKSDKYYIVYKYNQELFCARYENEVGKVELDTDLSSEEIQMLQTIIDDTGAGNL